MDEYKFPLKFKAHYEADCGEAYEIYGVGLPFLSLPCEECEETHSFKLVRVEHWN